METGVIALQRICLKTGFECPLIGNGDSVIVMETITCMLYVQVTAFNERSG